MVENHEFCISFNIQMEMHIHSSLKKLPSVERVLESERVASVVSPFSRRGITQIIREKVDLYRKQLLDDTGDSRSETVILEDIVDDVLGAIEAVSSTCQRRVINASGVILHTNLGRAVLGGQARLALERASTGYVDLEVDIESGKRIQRDQKAVRLLTLLTGAESGLVVNNTAAAVLLAINTFAGSGAVAVSRGELVEIGGSFRLPEILSSAAGRVIEIGTTNRTHLEDYEEAIDNGATLLLKVHTSNYRIVGYTNDVPLSRLAALGRARRVPVMYDQGSGMLFPFGKKGPEGEEDICSIIESGVDIISFSGDKVLGGPQAGIILGREELVGRLRKNHIMRALRIDKLTLACLETVLLQYWCDRTDNIPALVMMGKSFEEIRKRADGFSTSLSKRLGSRVVVSVVEGESSIGGGSFPINPLRTALVRIDLKAGQPEKLSSMLRSLDPAVLVRVKNESVYVDLRTVDTTEEEPIQESLVKGIDKISGRE